MTKYTAIGPFALLVIWSVASQLKLIDVFLFPSPFATVNELYKIIATGMIFSDLIATLWRVVLSFLIALAIGLPIGLILGGSEKLYRSVEFIIDFFRSTPATALFPLFLLVFGITDKSKIAISAFAAIIIIIFNTAFGVMHAKKSRILAARIMGATKTQIFRLILLWESMPYSLVGIKSAVSLSLIIIIVTEMFIGTRSGLGKAIIDAQITYEIKTMYAVILLVGILGYVLNAIFSALEKKFFHWAGKL